MKPFQKILAFVLTFSFIAASAGCAAPKPQPPAVQTEAPSAPAAAQPLRMPALKPAQPLPTPNADAATTQGAGAGAGANEFAFRLAAALSEKDKNMVISPFSVWMTLAALSNATGQDALPQLLASLSLEDLSVEDINASIATMLFALTNGESADTYNPLSIANAVFVDNTVTLKQDFAQKFLDYYRGSAMNVDFSDPSAIKAINDWASEHTKGLITDIVKEMPRDAVAAIANAIYFSDRWTLEFDEAKTTDMVFHGANGDVTVPFMLREGDGIPYYEDDALQAIDLAFKNGAGLTILLPKDGEADALLSGMTAARFDEILGSMTAQTGKLLLPRFELNSHFELNDALKQLGVPLFDSETLPITGLIEEDDTYISSGLHQANIKVDEKGTTATAVTVQIISRLSLPAPTEPFTMVADRPFMFVLHQWTPEGGQQVLFTGVVNQL